VIRRLAAAIALLIVCAAVDLVALVWMAVAFAAGSPRGWRLAIAQDQLANALAGGDEDEVVSSRAWRHQARAPWRWLRPAIDWVAAQLGDADHCRKAYEAEQLKAATRAGWRFKEKG
jgi:hypothetical protein